jgi:hypothetical protein
VATSTKTRDLEVKEQKLIQSGLRRLEVIPQPTGPGGIHRSDDGRYWMTHTGGAKVSPDKLRLFYTLDGDLLTVWREVDSDEMFQAEKKAAAESEAKAEAQRSEGYLLEIIKSGHRVRIAPRDQPGLSQVEPTLDAVEDLIAKTGATVKVTPSGHGLIVEAALEEELVAIAERSKRQQPKFGLKKIAGHDNRVRLLVDLLAELGPLGIEWAKAGKRPPSDIGKGPANRVDRLGAWTQ